MATPEVERDFEWRLFAACANTANPDVFFAEGHGATYPIARKYCSTCPVVIDCLVEALDSDNVGMWGCTSPDERTRIKRVMADGYSLKQAAEFIWNEQRRNGSRGEPVPKTLIWKDWNA